MAKNFTATVKGLTDQYRDRLLAVAQTATLAVVEDAQTPVAKGGRMRVDTGFLRASGQASLSGLPVGPSRGERDQKYDFSDGANLIVGQMTLGDSFWFGWTAEYAIYREAYDGFLDLAVQKWQRFVDDAVRQARSI